MAITLDLWGFLFHQIGITWLSTRQKSTSPYGIPIELEQQSPVFLTLGMDFVEDDPSTGWGWWEEGFRTFQSHHIYRVLYLDSNAAAADLTGGTDLRPGSGGP